MIFSLASLSSLCHDRLLDLFRIVIPDDACILNEPVLTARALPQPNVESKDSVPWNKYMVTTCSRTSIIVLEKRAPDPLLCNDCTIHGPRRCRLQNDMERLGDPQQEWLRRPGSPMHGIRCIAITIHHHQGQGCWTEHAQVLLGPASFSVPAPSFWL